MGVRGRLAAPMTGEAVCDASTTFDVRPAHYADPTYTEPAHMGCAEAPEMRSADGPPPIWAPRIPTSRHVLAGCAPAIHGLFVWTRLSAVLSREYRLPGHSF